MLVKLKLFIALFLFLVVASGEAQEYNSEIDSVLSIYGETFLKVRINDRSDVNLLSSFTSVAGVSGDTVIVNVNRPELTKLIAAGFQFIHFPIPRPDDKYLMVPEGETSGTWDYYPTWQAFDSIMYSFEQQYPALCKTFNFHTLASNRKLLIVKLTSGVTPIGGKPLFLYTSTMHGNETAGYILMLRLIDHLLSGYGTDPESTWLLDNMEIWICPLANPDGAYYGGNHTVSGAIRRNANNVDLNRNFHDPRTGPNPDGNPYQPETIAFMELADTLPFTMGANLHSGAEVVNYPWDTWTKLHPDNQWWVQVSRNYADTVQANSPAGFFTYLNNGITNGAAWYVITGGRQDYMNYFAHCRELTLEVSNIFILPANQLNSMWNYHHRALIRYMKEGWYGLRGTVTDSVTGLPLQARVWLNSHDADSSHVWSGLSSGEYFRPVYSGSYSVTWSANGYHPQSQQVYIPNQDTVVVNIAMVPLGISSGMRDFDDIRIWYNSSYRCIVINRPLISGTDLSLYSIDGKRVFYVKNPGTQIPVELKPGVYIISVNSPDQGVYRKRLGVESRE